jgi:predicted O-methyltransferase YrrM
MNVEHFYQTIPGYFTFPDYYRWLAESVPPYAHLVEVGVDAGQSAAFLGVELFERAPARLDLVDVFGGGAGVEVVRRNLEPLIATDRVALHFHTALSWDAASLFRDGSLDAVFLDADHSYESVCKDVAAWLPKVKAGGVLAGHDYTPEIPDVIRAVTEAFPIVEVWRGERFKGPRRDQPEGNYYPVWSVRV